MAAAQESETEKETDLATVSGLVRATAAARTAAPIRWEMASPRPCRFISQGCIHGGRHPREIQGTAILSCVVTPDGVCTDIEIVRSLDNKFGLDVEAIKNVKLWKWRPGMRLGQKVAVKVLCEIEFTIR